MDTVAAANSMTLTCRLVSGHVVAADLGGVHGMRDVRDKVADSLGLLSFEHEVLIVCGGELLDDSTSLSQLLELQCCHGEVTVIAKARDLIWEPTGFSYLGKGVQCIVRSSESESNYVIKYWDESWCRYGGSPQLDALFSCLRAKRRMQSQL
jgi:hypothetical protein